MINHESYAIAQVPCVLDFVRRVDEKLSVPSLANFWSSVEDFEKIIDRQVWDAVFASAVSRVADDPAFNGGRDWGVQGFLLAESDAFHFSVRSSKRPELGRNVIDSGVGDPPNIASVIPAPSVMFAIAPRDVCFNVFEFPASCDLDIFDPNARIRFLGKRAYRPWSRIDVDAPRESLELVKDSTKECCIIELAMKPVSAQRWEFDRNSGIPTAAVMLSRESVVLKTMLEEVGRFKYAPALGAAVDLIGHPDFNVRWASMRCAFAIDASIGRDLLERLALDVNPYVRSSAMNVLHSFSRGGPNAN